MISFLAPPINRVYISNRNHNFAILVFVVITSCIFLICFYDICLSIFEFVIYFSEATVEVLPRLFKIKYESGTLEELLYVDMPREYQNSSGQIVLDYAKAIQESVFEQLRVVRDGQLRIVFSQDLKVVLEIKLFFSLHWFHAV